MAGIDSSIYQQLIRPPKSVAEYDAESLANQQNRLALQVSQSAIADKARAMADGNRLRQVVQGFGADKTANYQSILSSTGDLKAAQAYEKANTDADEGRAKVAYQNAQAQETHYKAVNLKMTQAKDMFNTIQTPQQAALLVEGMYKDADLAQVFAASGDTVEAAKSRIPTDPAGFQKWKMQASLGADKLIEYTTPTANTVATNNTSIATNAATNSRIAAEGAANRSVQIRGQDQVNEREKNAPRGQIVQTDNGPLLVDPRTGASKPVLNPDGTTAEAKLKPLPAQVQKGLMENSAALRKVDAALAAIDAYPDALGAKNYLGDTITQRTDLKGVEARALVADIGSLKLHDRSGAAVTASETPRLKPFIPSSTDDLPTVKKKLGLFKQEYDAIEQDIRETYSRDQGYKLPQKLVAKPPPATPTAAPAAYSDAAKEARYQAFLRSQGK